jgi:hypothetical protein
MRFAALAFVTTAAALYTPSAPRRPQGGLKFRAADIDELLKRDAAAKKEEETAFATAAQAAAEAEQAVADVVLAEAGATKKLLPTYELLPTYALVDNLLDAVDGTDRGAIATTEEKAAIATQIERLEASYYNGAPFDDAENLYRDGTVAYVGQASSKAANAAGGRFRGRVGRALFRTRGLFQHIVTPDTAVNIVSFRLFGLFDGAAVLTGTVKRTSKSYKRLEAMVKDPKLVEAAERIEAGASDAQSKLTEARSAVETGPISASACLVEFAKPRIALGGAVFELGPTSSVALDTTYLDERIRIIRGGVSGIPFVITRVDAADLAAAGEWRRIAACRRVLKPRGALALAVGAAVLLGGACRRPLVGLPLLLLGLAVARSTGGIVVDDDGASTGDEKLLAEAAWNR